MRRRQAFTLIELLFVVAIIAVLAAIAVPNFLEAQTRSKLARARCDMAVLKAAIRAYVAQHEAYPPHAPERLKWLREFRSPAARQSAKPPEKASPAATPASSPMPPGMLMGPMLGVMIDPEVTRYPLLEQSGWDLVRLTTPVAWLSRTLPMDVFGARYGSGYGHPPDPPVPFIYIDLHDVLDDAGAKTTAQDRAGYLLLSYGPDNTLKLPNPVLGPFTEYDPTNGTVSNGDLLLRGW